MHAAFSLACPADLAEVALEEEGGGGSYGHAQAYGGGSYGQAHGYGGGYAAPYGGGYGGGYGGPAGYGYGAPNGGFCLGAALFGLQCFPRRCMPVIAAPLPVLYTP